MVKNSERILMNIKTVKIMRACGYSDKEIADQLGMGVREFLEGIAGDEYIKEIYEHAEEKLVTEIERAFLSNVMIQVGMGDNTDAKWLLERRSKKYAKKEQVEVNIKSIDEIIRGE